jgi:SAM-dependent methyltransferase
MIPETSQRNIDSSQPFYDAIAAEYEEILLREPVNASLRQTVAEEFLVRVPQGKVMDFGGGTGLDLEWLVGGKYQILFCEPSRGMRAQAVARCGLRIPASQVRFLEQEETDFRIWGTSPPCGMELEAILANFGVLNCLADTGRFFQMLGPLLKKGGRVVALVLDKKAGLQFRHLLGKPYLPVPYRTPRKTRIGYGGQEHTAYYHPLKKLVREAVLAGMHLEFLRPMAGSPFVLLIVKKPSV